MDSKIEKVKLKMWEAVKLPESIYSQEQNKYVPTGKKIEKTTYYFVDEWGTKLVFIGDNSFRLAEGKTGVLSISVEYDNYKKVNKVQFKNFEIQD